MFNIFEDSEAVIKMIIKGNSPTMKHTIETVFRTIISVNQLSVYAVSDLCEEC